MGYRSTVVVGMSHETYSRFLPMLWRRNGLCGVEHPLVGVGWDGRRHDFGIFREYPKGVVVGFADVKWYPGWPEVDAFEDALGALEAQGRSFRLVRLGEDPQDIDERESGDPYGEGAPYVYAVTGWDVC